MQSVPPPPETGQVGADALAGAVLLAATGVGLTPFALVLARRLVPGRRVFFARWGFTHLAALLALAFCASIALAFLWPWPEEGEPGLLETLGRLAVMFVVVALFIARLAARLEPEPAAALGLARGGNLRAVSMGLAVYLLLLPGMMGLNTLWPIFLQFIGEPPEQQSVLLGFLELSGWPLALGIVGGVIVVPFFEELVFRGFLQPLLVQNFRDRGGIVLTSLVFAALHGTTAFLPIFVLSLILGGVMLRTRRLAAAWAVHAAHNGLTLAVALNLPEPKDLEQSAELLIRSMP